MNWEKQITLTVRINLAIHFTQWMLGFNVINDTGTESGMFAFLQLNFFVGPIRFGAMREPLRQKQLDWRAAMEEREEDHRRDLKYLRSKRDEMSNRLFADNHNKEGDKT